VKNDEALLIYQRSFNIARHKYKFAEMESEEIAQGVVLKHLEFHKKHGRAPGQTMQQSVLDVMRKRFGRINVSDNPNHPQNLKFSEMHYTSILWDSEDGHAEERFKDKTSCNPEDRIYIKSKLKETWGKRRVIFFLHYIYNFTQQEIADVLGVAVSRVNQLIKWDFN
jgi:predicted XRE-type DNA-binding protein